MSELKKQEEEPLIGSWGYAVVKKGAIWIPAVFGPLHPILQNLYEITGIKRMIFSAVLNPDSFKTHLKNIIREWDEWFEEAKDYSHCIEIEYEPNEEIQKSLS
jgi:hypothetical protein